MNDSDRDVLRTIVREEVRAAFMDHEADLAVARVRRSAALEELARMDGELLYRFAEPSWNDAQAAAIKAQRQTIGDYVPNKIRA